MYALNALNCYDMASGTIALGIPVKLAIDSLFLRTKDTRTLPSDRRSALQDKVNDLAEKLDMRKPLQLIETNKIKKIVSSGNTLFQGKAGILINPEYFHESNPLNEFELAHAIAKIKNNDVIVTSLIAGLVGVITNIALKILFPQLPPSSFSGFKIDSIDIATFISGFAAGMIFDYRSCRTEQMAFSMCSRVGQQAVIDNLRQQQVDNINKRNDANVSKISAFFRKVFIKENGDLISLTNYPLSIRIREFTAIQTRT